MSDRSYTISLTVERAPLDVFAAINDVPSWWNEDTTGRAEEVGAVFIHNVETIHRAEIQVTELVSGERVVWRVLDNWFGFIQDQREWKDTEIRFELFERDGATEIRFTHVGLTPDDECFDVCYTAWGFYIGESLRSRITTGTGRPNASPAERNRRQEAEVR